MPQKKRSVQWFIAPDPRTEAAEKLGLYLASEGRVDETLDRITVGGVTIDGFNVSHEIVTRFLKHLKANPHLKCTIFEREGGGEWRLSHLDKLSKKPAKVKTAVEKLKAITARNKGK
jgi:hypothetical protein